MEVSFRYDFSFFVSSGCGMGGRFLVGGWVVGFVVTVSSVVPTMLRIVGLKKRETAERETGREEK